MEDLLLDKTEDTLAVKCTGKSGIIEMEGVSYPENAFSFFHPIYTWIKKYFEEEKNSVVLNLRITYINSSSSKCFFDLFEMLEEYKKRGAHVEVNWYYVEKDIDIMESGELFKEDLIIPFNLIPT